MSIGSVKTPTKICSKCGKEHKHYIQWEPFSEGESRYICKLCWTETMDKVFNIDGKFNLENEKLLYGD